MIIGKPYIENRNNECFLISQIKDEIENVEKEIFFSVPSVFGKYLCDEVADAFVVAMLLPAIVSGQDIKINALISELLLFQIENSLIYIFQNIFKKRKIKIYHQGTTSIKFDSTAVVTGFSGGVDSFTTFFNHCNSNNRELKLTHLALFNVGAYGNKEQAEKTFFSDVNRAKKFAKDVNLPLITLNSNISILHNYKEIFPFSSRNIMNIISAILAVQKKIKTYLISSAYTIDKIKIDWDQGYYDTLLAYALSNENTRIIISESNLKRVEKIDVIKNELLVQKHLYVCAADIYNEKYNMGFTKTVNTNCSECDKCTRTLLVLDFLGQLKKYEQRFNLNKYYKNKKNLIIKVLVNHKKDYFLQEIYELIISTNSLSLHHTFLAEIYKLRVKLASIKVLRKTYNLFFK